MATGSLSNGVCYESVDLATDAFYSSLPPSSFSVSAPYLVNASWGDFVVTSGSVVTSFFVKPVAGPYAGLWVSKVQSFDALGVAHLISQVPVNARAFPSCYAPSEAFNDGVSIGWAVVGSLTTVFFVMMIKKALGHG